MLWWRTRDSLSYVSQWLLLAKQRSLSNLPAFLNLNGITGGGDYNTGLLGLYNNGHLWLYNTRDLKIWVWRKYRYNTRDLKILNTLTDRC